jgi:hypothetical protein
LKKNEKLNQDQLNDLNYYLEKNQSNEEWNKIVSQAIISTALAVITTASLVFLTDIDFGFM